MEKPRTKVSGLEDFFTEVGNVGGRAFGRWGGSVLGYGIDVLMEYPGRNPMSDGGAKV